MSDNIYQTQNDANDIAFRDINRSQRLSLRKSAPIYNFAERNPIPEETPGNSEDVEVRNVSGRRSISNVTSYRALSFIQENMIADEQKKQENVVLNTRYDGDIPYIREEEWDSVLEALKLEGSDKEENVEKSECKEEKVQEQRVDEEIVVSRLEPLKEYPILQRMASVDSIRDEEDIVDEASEKETSKVSDEVEVDDVYSKSSNSIEKIGIKESSIKEVPQRSTENNQSKKANATEKTTNTNNNRDTDKLPGAEKVPPKEEEVTSNNKRHTICFEPKTSEKKTQQRRKWSTSSHSAVADLENIHYVNGSTQTQTEDAEKKSKKKKSGVKKFLSAIFGSSRSKKQKQQKTVTDK